MELAGARAARGRDSAAIGGGDLVCVISLWSEPARPIQSPPTRLAQFIRLGSLSRFMLTAIAICMIESGRAMMESRPNFGQPEPFFSYRSRCKCALGRKTSISRAWPLLRPSHRRRHALPLRPDNNRYSFRLMIRARPRERIKSNPTQSRRIGLNGLDKHQL